MFFAWHFESELSQNTEYLDNDTDDKSYDNDCEFETSLMRDLCNDLAILIAYFVVNEDPLDFFPLSFFLKRDE